MPPTTRARSIYDALPQEAESETGIPHNQQGNLGSPPPLAPNYNSTNRYSPLPPSEHSLDETSHQAENGANIPETRWENIPRRTTHEMSAMSPPIIIDSDDETAQMLHRRTESNSRTPDIEMGTL